MDIPGIVKLDALQHERNFDQLKTWYAHWGTMTEERSKVNFLMMLKSRRDNNNDALAEQAFGTLAHGWMSEKYANGQASD
jgi:hypothetical protein